MIRKNMHMETMSTCTELFKVVIRNKCFARTPYYVFIGSQWSHEVSSNQVRQSYGREGTKTSGYLYAEIRYARQPDDAWDHCRCTKLLQMYAYLSRTSGPHVDHSYSKKVTPLVLCNDWNIAKLSRHCSRLPNVMYLQQVQARRTGKYFVNRTAWLDTQPHTAKTSW